MNTIKKICRIKSTGELCIYKVLREPEELYEFTGSGKVQVEMLNDKYLPDGQWKIISRSELIEVGQNSL